MSDSGAKLCASDVMQAPVLTLSPDDSLEAALTLFREARIGGAPVVDPFGRLVGVISVFDLLGVVESLSQDAGCSLFLRDHPLSWTTEWSFRLEDRGSSLRGVRVGERMSPAAVCVSPATPVTEIAHTMRAAHIHRVIVCADERVLGIVSSFDLLAVLERSGE